MERCDLFTIKLCQIFHNLFIGSLIHIHIGYIYHTRQMILFAELPRFQCTDFHTCLSGNNNDRCVCSGNRFFHLAYKIKIAGCIQQIDLTAIPFDRNTGGRYGKMPFLFFFSIITDRITVRYLPHTGCDTAKICHCFSK